MSYQRSDGHYFQNYDRDDPILKEIIFGDYLEMNQDDIFKATMPRSKVNKEDDLVEAILIQDKSGSMELIWNDTIGAMNAFIREQQTLPGRCSLTLAVFDHSMKMVHTAKPIRDVEPLSPLDISPYGGTALYDAIGHVVVEVLRRHADMPKKPRTLLVINTDGEENSSSEYNKSKIKDLLAEVQTVGWEILYLGANQDAMAEGGKIGIQANSTVIFQATGESMKNAYNRTGKVLSNFRAM